MSGINLGIIGGGQLGSMLSEAAKKLIKRAKLNRNWYTPEEVKYAKMIRKQLDTVTVNPEEPKL